MDDGIVEAIGYDTATQRVVVQCRHCGAMEMTAVTRDEMLATTPAATEEK